MKLAPSLLLVLFLVAAGAAAQSPAPRLDGPLILMAGAAEIEVPNDEALVSFFVEAQDPDLARAQSQVNQRMADGTALLKRNDPKALIETSGYSSYPIYSRDGGRKITGWRVRQSLNLRTVDLAGLSRTVAAAQQQLALGGVAFQLSRAARARVEAELILAALDNLNARVAAAAQALSVPASRVRIEELNFGVHGGEGPPIVAFARGTAMAAEAVAEPGFEAGVSAQRQTVTAKVRLVQP